MPEKLREDLVEGDVLLRPEGSPLLFLRRIYSPTGAEQLSEFRDLETGNLRRIGTARIRSFYERRGWTLLERSHPAMPSGSVGSEGNSLVGNAGQEDTVMKKPNLTSKTRIRIPAGLPMTSPNADEAATIPAPAEKPEAKSKKTRTVDYTRTDKRPHSFRYKRGSTFVPRAGAVVLSKESDGCLVIGPATDGAQAEAANLEAGTLELVSVKKRPNGKTAIAFKHPELGEVVAYDARAARAALRAS